MVGTPSESREMRTEAPRPGAFSVPSRVGFEPTSSTERKTNGTMTKIVASNATIFTIVARLSGRRTPG